ncbi:MAG TPA: hypothetical protein PKY56_07585 [Candidatus Kapabacteria bacterium]|nr:hypothetical protein [Candidatus Kapabacteria bacterium]
MDSGIRQNDKQRCHADTKLGTTEYIKLMVSGLVLVICSYKLTTND